MNLRVPHPSRLLRRVGSYDLVLKQFRSSLFSANLCGLCASTLSFLFLPLTQVNLIVKYLHLCNSASKKSSPPPASPPAARPKKSSPPAVSPSTARSSPNSAPKPIPTPIPSSSTTNPSSPPSAPSTSCSTNPRATSP